MIIDVILACSLNFCEFDCLFKKVAYEVNMDYELLKSIVYVESKFNPYLNVRLGAEIYLYCYEKTKDKLLALDCYNKGDNKKLSRKSTYVKKVLNAYNMF
jgi:membrane-bound lytic murein transglycosylase MltF